MPPYALPKLPSGKTEAARIQIETTESGHLEHIPYEKVRIFSLSNETLSLQITHVRFHVAEDSLLGNETLVI